MFPLEYLRRASHLRELVVCENWRSVSSYLLRAVLSIESLTSIDTLSSYLNLIVLSLDSIDLLNSEGHFLLVLIIFIVKFKSLMLIIIFLIAIFDTSFFINYVMNIAITTKLFICLTRCSTTRSQSCIDWLIPYSTLFFKSFCILSISILLPILLDPSSKNLLVLFLAEIILWSCGATRCRWLLFTCHLSFRHNFMNSAFDHLGFWDYVFQDCIAHIVHVQRKAVCSRVINLRVVNHHAIFCPNWVSYATSKCFCENVTVS